MILLIAIGFVSGLDERRLQLNSTGGKCYASTHLTSSTAAAAASALTRSGDSQIDVIIARQYCHTQPNGGCCTATDRPRLRQCRCLASIDIYGILLLLSSLLFLLFLFLFLSSSSLLKFRYEDVIEQTDNISQAVPVYKKNVLFSI